MTHSMFQKTAVIIALIGTSWTTTEARVIDLRKDARGFTEKIKGQLSQSLKPLRDRFDIPEEYDYLQIPRTVKVDHKLKLKELSINLNTWVVNMHCEVHAKPYIRAGGKHRLRALDQKINVYYAYDVKKSEAVRREVSIRTPLGPVTMTLDQITKLMNGQISDLMYLIPSGGVVDRKIKSNRRKLRDEYYREWGRDNVYFSSKGFVRWASEAMVGEEVIKAVASQGASVKNTMKMVEKKAAEEWELLAPWLADRGVSEARTIAQKLLRGESVDAQLPQLKLVWQIVWYSSKLEVAGSQIGGEFNTNRHLAFALIWKTGQTSNRRARPYPENQFARNEDQKSESDSDIDTRSVMLHRLTCLDAEEFFNDEIQLRVVADGSPITLQHPHRTDVGNGFVPCTILDKGETWNINQRVEFENDLLIEVWEIDDPASIRGDVDDFVGRVNIAQATEDSIDWRVEIGQIETFAHYRLEWDESI